MNFGIRFVRHQVYPTDSDLTRLSPIPEYVLNDERKGVRSLGCRQCL